MSEQSVILSLPESLYEQVRRVAEKSDRPVELVLIDTLALLFGELPSDSELDPQSLNVLADEQLWALVYRSLAWPIDARLRELSAMGKSGSLSDAEQNELDVLVDQVDRYVLLRSHALLLLKQRGHDVERRLRLSA